MVSATSQEATWDEISTLGYFYYQLLPGTLTKPELKLISQNHEIPRHTGYFEVIQKTTKFLGVQREGVTLKSCIHSLSDTDATISTDLELVDLDNLWCSEQSSQPSASTSTAQPSRLQTYSSKQRRLQVT